MAEKPLTPGKPGEHTEQKPAPDQEAPKPDAEKPGAEPIPGAV